MSGSFPTGAMLLAWSSILLAQEKPLIEEIIVTAQRFEESAQRVPISIAAFTDTMIEDRQFVGLKDLHLNVPNVSFSPRPDAGAAHLRIRGIGWQNNGYGNDNPSSTHLNEIPFPQSFASLEFYDLERIELMRGPQGTLFGRNATSGALNVVTRKPSLGGVIGYAELEYGNYDSMRVLGALNVPVGDKLGFRLAGTSLDRDGFLKNRAAEQLPGIKRKVDDKDYHSFRVTGLWQIAENAKLWLMYDRMEEDSNRGADTFSICKRSRVPVGTGCVPGAFGREGAHPARGLNVNLGLAGIIPLGARDAATGLVYRFPLPADLASREVLLERDREWEVTEELWSFGFEWEFDQLNLSVTGGHQQSEWLGLRSNSLFNWEQIGIELGPTAQNPSGLWPMSAIPRSIGFLRGDTCNLDAYQAGVPGGCIETIESRSVDFLTQGERFEYWTVEAKLRSEFEGPINFLLGASYADLTADGLVAFGGNIPDMFTTQNVAGLGPVYPAYFGTERSGEDTESVAFFAELYWQLSNAVKVTAGLRYNEDEKRPNHALLGFQSADINALRFLGPDPIWVRFPMTSYLFPGGPSPEAVALAEYYDASEPISAAGSFPELIAALQLVPPVERPGERRALAGKPAVVRYKEWSGRFVVDWLMAPNVLSYAKYNRGFKPGGFGLHDAQDFDSEIIDSFEVGLKSRLFDGTLMLNVAAFIYDYQGLQVASTSFVNIQPENVDVDGHGIEVDVVWRPPQLQNLSLELAYGWLDTELDDYVEIDEGNRTQGDPSLILLSDTTDAMPLGGPYIAPVADVLPLVDSALANNAAIGEDRAPGTLYPNGIPAYFSRAFLEANGVPTANGVAVNMRGNSLRHSPEHSISLGVAYSWFMGPGTLTARWDYYWQGASYASVFNSPFDRIDDWSRQSASLTFESARNRWSARLWVRNIADKDYEITRLTRGQVVLDEPRVYGISARFNFGTLDM